MRQSDSLCPPVIERFAGIECQLELGPYWSRERVEALLTSTRAQSANASEQLSRLAQAFQGTPFLFESKLPILPRGRMRVRLASFDCITFIYTMLAMCGARDFDDFVRRLYTLRYRNEAGDAGPDNDPDTGNIFDFACESLLEVGVRKGLLSLVTEAVAGQVPLKEFRVELKRFQRDAVFDEERRFVSPKLGTTVYGARFLPPEGFGDMRLDEVRSGDLVLLTRGETTKDGKPSPVLIAHLVVAQKEEGQLYFIHATRNFSWRPDATPETPPSFTGIFYDEQRRKEQIGIGFGTQYAGDEHTTRLGPDTLYGYVRERRRTLRDYMGTSFVGALFLRPLWPGPGE
jgi:hypothetical protein